MALPKRLRIRTKDEFQKVYRTGRTVYGTYFRAVIRQAESSKIGIVTPKKVGKAHDRQRLKRIFREAFRHLEGQLNSKREVIVFPNTKGKKASMMNVFDDLMAVLVKS